MSIISENLSEVDLLIDQVYGGSRNGNHSDEFLPKLLNVDNGAGFRYLGSPRTQPSTLKILVLNTNFSDPDWPDSLDKENGLFIYYGDKRGAGELHDTPRQGNETLRNIFEYLHTPGTNTSFPIILLFGKAGKYRDARFLGLAVPGAKDMSSDEDLTAVWRITEDGVRFQNYRAIFTVLDVNKVSRAWINDVQKGNALTSEHAPKVWLDWISKRKYKPLQAEVSKKIRDRKQQTDMTEEELAVINELHRRFSGDDRATDFEAVAAKIVEFYMPNAHKITLTKPWRDGGRDALGKYRICSGPGGIDVDFAIEAKCFALNQSVGVKHVSRLISRLRHRQFGVIVTTSYIGSQAYKEVVHDEHPVVVICAVDIAKLLLEKFSYIDRILIWLDKEVDYRPMNEACFT